MIRGRSAQVAVQIAIVSLLSYVCGAYFTGVFHSASAGTGGLWALMAGNFVLQETRRKTRAAAWLQLLGALVGSLVSAAYLVSFPYSEVGMAALAVGVVMVVSSLHPTLHPIRNAALRFCEA